MVYNGEDVVREKSWDARVRTSMNTVWWNEYLLQSIQRRAFVKVGTSSSSSFYAATWAITLTQIETWAESLPPPNVILNNNNTHHDWQQKHHPTAARTSASVRADLDPAWPCYYYHGCSCPIGFHSCRVFVRYYWAERCLIDGRPGKGYSRKKKKKEQRNHTHSQACRGEGQQANPERRRVWLIDNALLPFVLPPPSLSLLRAPHKRSRTSPVDRTQGNATLPGLEEHSLPWVDANRTTAENGDRPITLTSSLLFSNWRQLPAKVVVLEATSEWWQLETRRLGLLPFGPKTELIGPEKFRAAARATSDPLRLNAVPISFLLSHCYSA